MGLYPTALVRILDEICKDSSINTKSLCMLGKQTIHMNFPVYKKIIDIFGLGDDLQKLYNDNRLDSFDFFKKIGFNEIHAIDINTLDGADIILDLNEPLHNEYYERFDYIINGGTLEHVYNSYNAMSVITQMLRNNGKMIHISPLAGFVDHGFYSFSPTFFIDFAAANGLFIEKLDIEFMMSTERWDYSKYDELKSVFSPDVRLFTTGSDGYSKELNDYVKQFERMENTGHVYLWCIARKDKSKNIDVPMQGFYQRLYKNERCDV